MRIFKIALIFIIIFCSAHPGFSQQKVTLAVYDLTGEEIPKSADIKKIYCPGQDEDEQNFQGVRLSAIGLYQRRMFGGNRANAERAENCWWFGW